MPEFLNWKDRKKVPSFLKLGDEMMMGVVSIDPEKCNGCKVCNYACAASCLVVEDEKCRMVSDLPVCISCGDCVAICPNEAISITDYIMFSHFFKYIDRGEPEWPRKF
ncbi:MAG: 4Fe-4S binding protein [bacterium]